MRISGNRAPRFIINQYLDRRCNAEWPVSVAQAVTAVRMVIHTPLSEDDLAEMVAAAAVERGFCVSFDRDLLAAGPIL